MALWTCTVDANVVTAIYRNPPMNYFCAEGTAELGALIETWRDPAIKAVVLAGGTPGRFITHYSVEELLTYAEDRTALRRAGTALNDGYHTLLLSLRTLSKPVIVAMNGDAMGGGFELCLACDIRVAERGEFRYGLPEVKLGILPGGTGTQLLPRLIGLAPAVEFILRGRILEPAAAHAMGLVHELSDDALRRATELAHEMTQIPPVAMAMAKRAIYDGADPNLARGLKIEGASFLETMLSDGGVAAMREYVSVPFDQRRNWLERPVQHK